MADFNWNELDSVETPVTEEPKAEKASTFESVVKETQNKIKEKIAKDPAAYADLYRFSNFIEVVGSLGWTDKGNFIDQSDKDAYKKDENGNFIYDEKGKKVRDRKLVPVSKLVGYTLKNVSDDHVFEVTRKEYTREEDGNITSTFVTRKFGPGETIDLTKEDTAIFASQDGISCRFKNGTIVISVKGEARKSNSVDVLKNSHFTPSQNSNIYVNDETFKVQIGVPDGTTENGTKIWKVKPEYFTVFGGLEISKRKAPKAPTTTETGEKFDIKAAVIADIIRSAADEVYGK